MSDIEKYAGVIRGLEAKKQRLAERGGEIARERADLGFAVHADGDATFFFRSVFGAF